MKFETVNCTSAKLTPHTSAAGQLFSNAPRPPITSIKYAGMKSDTGAHNWPTCALISPIGRPVVAASVTSGMAIEPKATGAVLASRQIAAA